MFFFSSVISLFVEEIKMRIRGLVGRTRAQCTK
jgi:hypothetical protein